ITAEVVLALPFFEGAVVALDEQRILAEETSRLARILNTGVESQLRAGEIQTLRFRITPPGPK
ncbi:MAG TPA: hypothetical protein VJR48_06830, partial [Ktedonobacterales bacterium]|nr:hypothetical protein [Ktedonobacterales bacterium]